VIVGRVRRDGQQPPLLRQPQHHQPQQHGGCTFGGAFRPQVGGPAIALAGPLASASQAWTPAFTAIKK
jgi:hypothetical protein